MRNFIAFLLGLLLLLGTGLHASAQSAAYAEIAAVDTQGFPKVTGLLDVYDAQGQFLTGLQASDLTIYEDGQIRTAETLSESAPPAQIVVAINPGPALGVRGKTGVPRFDHVVGALSAWAGSQPGDSRDDLSLVTIAGPLIAHAEPSDWLVSLTSFQPDFRNTTPNLQALAIALDTVTAPAPQPGMKRAVLFITPHMDSSCSAKRDDMDALGCFCVNDGNCNATEKTERDKALLSISEAVILKGEGRTLEHARRIQEIDAMSLQIDPTFPFVPGEAHRRRVYTDTSNVKTPSCCALTIELSPAAVDAEETRVGYRRRLRRTVGQPTWPTQASPTQP